MQDRGKHWIVGLALATGACAEGAPGSPFSTGFGPGAAGPTPAAPQTTGDGADTEYEGDSADGPLGETSADTTDGEGADDGGSGSTGQPDAGGSGGLSSGCHPLAPDCGPNEGCYPQGGVFLCAIDTSGSSGVALDPCEFINVCNPGLACADTDDMPSCSGAFGCCTGYCDLTLVDSCSQGVCTPYYADGAAPPGHENVGWCLGY